MFAYECMIINKLCSDVEYNDLLNNLTNFLTENGGNVKKVNKWGKKKLAYPLQEQTEGLYTLLVFKAIPKAVMAFDKMIKADKNILSSMIIRNDKAYNF